MKAVSTLLLSIVCLLLYPVVANAQEVDVTLKGRVTGFAGTFGETYSAIGYEPSLTIKPGARAWAGGVSYSRNLLNYDANSALKADMSLLTFHAGARTTVARYFHPFAYALAGFRFMSYENEDLPSESSPVFSSVSLSYGARTGVQVGGRKWCFEGSLEYLSGTNSRYLTPETFRKASESGKSYRDVTQRSPISAFTVGVGITYVLSWADAE